METKTCTSCHVSKPHEDFSLRHDKRIPWCKACIAQKTRKWYKRNREKAILNSKNWVIKNRKRSNEIKKKWESKNREWRKSYLAEYRRKKRFEIKRPKLEKVECPECNRIHPKDSDSKGICIDCRIRQRTKAFERMFA